MRLCIEERDRTGWDYPGYIVRQQLMDTRGWSGQLIDEFMPEPDMIEQNPHKLSQRMRLYLLERVFKIEKTNKFKEHVLDAVGELPKDFKGVHALAAAGRRLMKEKRSNQASARRRINNKPIGSSSFDKLIDLGLL